MVPLDMRPGLYRPPKMTLGSLLIRIWPSTRPAGAAFIQRAMTRASRQYVYLYDGMGSRISMRSVSPRGCFGSENIGRWLRMSSRFGGHPVLSQD